MSATTSAASAPCSRSFHLLQAGRLVAAGFGQRDAPLEFFDRISFPAGERQLKVSPEVISGEATLLGVPIKWTRRRLADAVDRFKNADTNAKRTKKDENVLHNKKGTG